MPAELSEEMKKAQAAGSGNKMKRYPVTLIAALFILANCASGGTTGAPGRVQEPAVVYSLAIRMAEARIDRFVTTAEEALEISKSGYRGSWDSIGQTQRELPDGRIEYITTFRRGNSTTTSTVTALSLKNTTVALFGSISGPNEDLSAYDAQRLISQSKEWYANDPVYRAIVDIIEREVVTKLMYDWGSYYSGTYRSHEQAVEAGLGICDTYARLTKDVLSRAGYSAEVWSSSVGNHSWNHVVLPDGRTLYVDATWYDNNYENHPTHRSDDGYDPWYITFDKALFEHGLRGTINMHGAWPDARKVQ